MPPTRIKIIAETRVTLSLAWPLILGNLSQMAMTTTDVLVMGWLGSDSLAAGSLATNLFFAFIVFGLGLTSATAPMVAYELGRNRHSVREVRRTFRQGLWSVVIVTVPIWLLLWHTEAILHLLGQEPGLSAQAAHYMGTLQWSLLPSLGFFVLRAFMAALERPKPALVVMIGGILLNGFLVVGLALGRFGLPHLGLAGAGVATTLASTAMFIALTGFLLADRRLSRYRLFGRLWRPDWQRLREYWALGFPIAVTLLLEVSVFSGAAFMMGLIGKDALAGHQIAIQLASIAFMVPMGLGQAATVRVGRALGAGDRREVGLAGWVAFFMAEGFMLVSAATFLLVPRMLVGGFLDLADPANAEAVRQAVIFLSLAGLFQVADGAQALGAGMLRGIQDTRIPLFFAAFGYWGVGLPLGALLAFHFGLGGAGIWLGLAGGLAVVSVLMITRWARREELGLLGAHFT
jgi:MATE family multidrug resistance protein